MPITINYHGDATHGETLKGLAMKQLVILENHMAFQNLQIYGRVLKLNGGREIHVGKRFGMVTMNIYVPQVIVEEIELIVEEEYFAPPGAITCAFISTDDYEPDDKVLIVSGEIPEGGTLDDAEENFVALDISGTRYGTTDWHDITGEIRLAWYAPLGRYTDDNDQIANITIGLNTDILAPKKVLGAGVQCDYIDAGYLNAVCVDAGVYYAYQCPIALGDAPVGGEWELLATYTVENASDTAGTETGDLDQKVSPWHFRNDGIVASTTRKVIHPDGGDILAIISVEFTYSVDDDGVRTAAATFTDEGFEEIGESVYNTSHTETAEGCDGSVDVTTSTSSLASGYKQNLIGVDYKGDTRVLIYFYEELGVDQQGSTCCNLYQYSLEDTSDIYLRSTAGMDVHLTHYEATGVRVMGAQYSDGITPVAYTHSKGFVSYIHAIDARYDMVLRTKRDYVKDIDIEYPEEFTTAQSIVNTIDTYTQSLMAGDDVLYEKDGEIVWDPYPENFTLRTSVFWLVMYCGEGSTPTLDNYVTDFSGYVPYNPHYFYAANSLACLSAEHYAVSAVVDEHSIYENTDKVVYLSLGDAESTEELLEISIDYEVNPEIEYLGVL